MITRGPKIIEFRAGFNLCGLAERIRVASSILFRKRFVLKITEDEVRKILVAQKSKIRVLL